MMTPPIPTSAPRSLFPERPHRTRVWVVYCAILTITLSIFFWIRGQGQALVTGAHVSLPLPSTAENGSRVLAHLLLALAVITVSARGAGMVCERVLRQPAVIAEIVVGLALGPSLLGALMPGVSHFLWPDFLAPQLGMVSKIGVVLFMFLVGIELDGALVRGNSHATITIAHASILVPFLLGSSLSLMLYPLYARPGADFTIFALFLGVSLSVTAFPVLARILAERRWSTTELGVTALACAAVDDASAWCLLALVSGIARAEVSTAAVTLTMTVAFVIVMLVVVRPSVAKLVRRVESSGADVSLAVQALVFTGMLLSAFASETIGIHALFGAFLFGAIIPPNSRLAEQIRIRLEDTVVVLMLPVFFVFSGLRTRLGLISGLQDWLYCGAIILAATVGKFGGCFVAARAAGLNDRDASALGILMNTRGLMELIVLNVGLDMGILSPTLFAMLVIMALVTTFATTPLLSLVLRLPSSGPLAVPAMAGAREDRAAG